MALRVFLTNTSRVTPSEDFTRFDIPSSLALSAVLFSEESVSEPSSGDELVPSSLKSFDEDDELVWSESNSSDGAVSTSESKLSKESDALSDES